MAGILDRLRASWNVFTKRDVIDKQIREFYLKTSENGEPTAFRSYGGSSRPDRARQPYSVERTTISSIYTRLSVDVSDVAIRHVRLDEEDRYAGDVDSRLNSCLTVRANTDQPGRMFRQDLALTLITHGVAAIVPIEIETTTSPFETLSFDIRSLRVGTVAQWYPETVVVNVYNPIRGQREDIELPKSYVAIVENPFYSVMNEPSSTLQRLSHKLSLLDAVDEQTSSGKLDLIIQLPYVIKSEARRLQAEARRKDIEFQLRSGAYGIAYTDGTERITQLNRPVENNLLKQVEYLTKVLYSQLGLTEEILAGTASEEAMTNYHSRTINPIVEAIVESMHSTFLTQTARSQRQAIRYFRDPFKAISPTKLAELSDPLTRNEIATKNEIRILFGWKPSTDPNADKLKNANMPEQKETSAPPAQNGSEPAPLPEPTQEIPPPSKGN